MPRRLWILGLMIAATAWALPAVPAAAATQTVVSIQFDDGTADQYTVRAILASHQMHATFYVNSGLVGDATHLSWAQVHDCTRTGTRSAGTR